MDLSITLILPSGSKMQSSMACRLVLSQIPVITREGHIHSTLISIDRIFDVGYQIIFHMKAVSILQNGRMLLTVIQDHKYAYIYCP